MWPAETAAARAATEVEASLPLLARHGTGGGERYPCPHGPLCPLERNREGEEDAERKAQSDGSDLARADWQIPLAENEAHRDAECWLRERIHRIRNDRRRRPPSPWSTLLLPKAEAQCRTVSAFCRCSSTRRMLPGAWSSVVDGRRRPSITLLPGGPRTFLTSSMWLSDCTGASSTDTSSSPATICYIRMKSE